MRFYLSLYAFVAGFYLLTASGRIGLSDGEAMFRVAQSVVDKGSFSSEPCEPDARTTVTGYSIGCVPGVRGGRYAAYGLVPSLAAAPAILCARLISGIAHTNPLVTSKAGVCIFTLLIASLASVVLAVWMLKLGYSRRTAAAGACILALASPYWHFSVTGLFSEPYCTLALLASACLLSSPRRRFACWLAGLAFGVACGARVNGMILFPAFILSMALHIRAHKLSMAQFLRDSAQFSASFSVCALLIAWANYARFGGPFKTGYHLAYSSAPSLVGVPLLRGLFQILFNGEVGLLLFAPWVLMALVSFPRFVRAHLIEAALCGAVSAIYFVFIAKYGGWHGGSVAGPRMLVPILPFLVVAMAPAIQGIQRSTVEKQRRWTVIRRLTMVLVGAGFLIQCVGAMFPDQRYYFLMDFYKHMPAKPWWYGSIPLASVDFLWQMRTAKEQATRAVELDPMVARHERERALAAVESANNQDDYLRSLPNSVNYTLPNLMLFKLRVLGVPTSGGLAYLLAAVAIGCAGAAGIRRCVALEMENGNVADYV